MLFKFVIIIFPWCSFLCCSCKYFLFKFNDLKEVKQFYDEIASAYFPDFDLFKNVYRRVTNIEHNFLLIDNDAKDENLKIRQNFSELIKI